MAPALRSDSMFSRCMSLNGVSLTANTSLRRSFKQTSADLEIRSSQKPIRTAASVFILQGTMIMPSCKKDPLDGGADMSFMVWLYVAKLLTSASVIDVSYFIVASAHLLMMRCVSMPKALRTSRILIAKRVPVAPVTPTTILFGLGGVIMIGFDAPSCTRLGASSRRLLDVVIERLEPPLGCFVGRC